MGQCPHFIPPKKSYYTHPLNPAYLSCYGGAEPRMGHCPHFNPPPKKRYYTQPFKPGTFGLLRGGRAPDGAMPTFHTPPKKVLYTPL